MSDETRVLEVLIVEDVDHKYGEVLAAVEMAIKQPFKVKRAKTVVEAQDSLAIGNWGLVVLDISMDIAPGSGGHTRDGHANLGGMDVIEQMYLLEREVPTIIVTGFDYFVSTTADSELQAPQTFSDLEKQARSWIGKYLIGCVRYGSTGWERTFISLLSGGKA